jgi:hypothetical protein
VYRVIANFFYVVSKRVDERIGASSYLYYKTTYPMQLIICNQSFTNCR